jgi:hypothetical protein
MGWLGATGRGTGIWRSLKRVGLNVRSVLLWLSAREAVINVEPLPAGVSLQVLLRTCESLPVESKVYIAKQKEETWIRS